RVLLHDLLEAPNVSNRQTLIKLRMEGVREVGDDAVGAGINIKVLHGLKLDGEDVGNHLRIARARPQERRPVDGSGNVGTWAESAVSVTDVTVVDINDVSTKKVEEVVHDQVGPVVLVDLDTLPLPQDTHDVVEQFLIISVSGADDDVQIDSIGIEVGANVSQDFRSVPGLGSVLLHVQQDHGELRMLDGQLVQ